MNYNEAVTFLQERLPMFQRVGAAAYKADLQNTIKLAKLFGNPELKFPSIHIAGTNGKGSVSHFTASILQEAGYRTALFTSPHLTDFRERFRIDGQMMPESFVIDFVEQIQTGPHCNEIQEISPSFFELSFVMGMSYFASQNVDIAVIEVGMGGRLDSTNIVNSILSVVTNISFDHKQFLGDTIQKIAFEKAGIFKKNIPVVIGRKQDETIEVFEIKAREMESEISFAEDLVEFSTENFNQTGKFSYGLDNTIYTGISPLLGSYQTENIRTVIALVQVFNTLNITHTISPQQILAGIENVVVNTNFLGRWQVIGQNPLTICDTGHNEDGLARTMKQLKEMEYAQLHIVMGVVNDKELGAIFQYFP
ncbi:MAG: bifunctional folylpolyglutamate synthase/dihydrofolate synthase, partial [Bacteroidales bacterium]|nr:bifunctional folylpolyglutamate synthase/dihydrofolate synthase [Bacteroidales bacterium]